jgi:hypothetical protein
VAAVLAVTVLTAACASTKSVSVRPAQGQDAERVARDRAECDTQAQRERDPGAVLVTAIFTPLAGAALGATAGVVAVFASNTSISSADDTRRVVGPIALGAAVGFAVGSVAAPVLSAMQSRKQEQAYLDLYAACLGKRGYWVTP